MAAEALAELGADAEIVGREDLDEAADLDGEADVADRGADIVLARACSGSGSRARN